jgi:HAD superfamily hydrolase (TIGR01459 family)
MASMRRVAGLKDFVGEYDSLLCDVWGVLHNGVAAFPAAVDALTRFRSAGGRVVLITNAPRPSAPIRVQLKSLGVPDDAYDAIVTSGDVTRGLLAERPGVRIRHIGAERDLALYAGLDLFLTSEHDAELVSCTGLFNDETETPEDYRLLLKRAVRHKLPMLCANPDLVVERGNKLVYCAGALATLYAELGGETILVGKPHAPIYEAAKRAVSSLGGKRPLAVGDGLPTDIRGAVKNGIPALFITGGIHAADFGPPGDPDAGRIAARLAAEGLSVEAYVPSLAWDAPVPRLDAPSRGAQGRAVSRERDR